MNDTSTPLTPEATLALVLDILNEAAEAHGVHEATVLGGVHDVEWPQWYADHMVANLEAHGYQIVGPTP
ncbi:MULTISPECIES: hypothetical protein [unclassified Leifsonia]|uniref:hypothetical protein n=1 Tax=unclassified Leifsonia TaxID=2663824 RepID=UPI0006F5EE0D|nr:MULTISPECIES: hypothetical protein [unclassified Leifsonia]KQX07748.1 hypothetical protein ASC59_08455 [Leifsonia sp. Root1293]KRA12030.1 hypothetical protein ASD61_08455 [Leifsonia sp. Root60]